MRTCALHQLLYRRRAAAAPIRATAPDVKSGAAAAPPEETEADGFADVTVALEVAVAWICPSVI